MLWDGFWSLLGAKNITWSFCFSPGMVTEFWFASRPHAWKLATAVSGASAEPDEEATHETQSMFCFAFSLILFQAAPVKNVWPSSCLFSGLRSSILRSDREVRAGTNLCKRYACLSPTSEGSSTSSQSKHWSGDRRVCRTCSAGPEVALYRHPFTVR